MGRDVPRPKGYAPLLELYLRVEKEGGDLRDPPIFHSATGATLRRSCLVLVHGFNNTEGDAAAAYFGFRGRQGEIFSLPDVSVLEQTFADAFWPGDADWAWFLDKLDFLVYPAAVHTAPNAGRAIADLLAQMPNLERVDFVGHSLGCRVVLEAIDIIRTRPAPLVGRVCLMAAAVSAESVEMGGRFYDTLAQICNEGARVHLLHSTDDTVLHFAFPPGQAAAGEPSLRALGRTGPTPDMFGYQAQLTGRQIAGAAHGDYWGHSHTGPSIVATNAAGKFFQFGTAGREVGEARTVGTTSPLPAPREMGTARRL